MLSKANIKFIKSLQVKKYRKQEQCFLVEGAKSVQELLASDFEVIKLLGTESFLSTVEPLQTEVIEVTEPELSGLGGFQSNNAALAVAKMKPNKPVQVGNNEFVLVLDDIRDTANLGTIIRTADWFGMHTIIASSETADFYNPKVITATMGSFTRVKIFYTPLAAYLKGSTQKIYGAYLNGKNVLEERFDGGGLIIIGNESQGITPELEKFVTNKITIPRYGRAESLNAAIATAIICDNVCRSRSGPGLARLVD